ncbi:ribulose-phosphate 3-epimerase [Guggenheimella bovis]
MLIAPSVLSADFSRLREEIEAIEDHAEWLHYDVMDGQFVPNISFGPKILKDIKGHTELFIDTHLMVNEPSHLFEAFVKSGSDLITIHVEAVKNVRKALDQIHGLGVLAGISLNPETDLSAILPYLDQVELVLIMSVHPGFGGQSFISSSIEKLEELVKIRAERGLSFKIEMDGGIGTDNALDLHKKGVDVIVAGSAIFKSDDYEKTIKKMRGIE